ncbi:hypothetical protein EVAR_66975_1 [Eumeta japonica]|uniref:Uncharacterized protein n=1 Tax=Eumeta variegata TaxID=151549 RepID=A0A4C1ZUI6_EUMVA|nr:hypothetical protein EVAR_66975_1 [Eumeta japonica]
MRWRSFVRGASTPSCLWVQVRDGGLTVASCPVMPRRLLSEIRPQRLRWQWSLSGGSIGWYRRPTTRGRARSSRMRSRQVEGGIRLNWLVLNEGGREAQLKLRMQPTAGGRTLVDADRIKAAPIGDPLCVDLTERACRPLIRLSTHPTAAAKAVRVSEPRPSTSLLCPRSRCQSGAYAGPPAGACVVGHALSGGWRGGTRL